MTGIVNSLRRHLFRGTASKAAPHLRLGTRGEELARDFLVRSEGYSIVASNVQIALGRGLDGRKISGEIDIVAYDEETLVFVEVKTRTTDKVLPPQRNVDLRKQRQIARVARRYRQLMKVYDEAYRYDVVTVVWDQEAAKIELLRGYFDENTFRRSRFFSRDTGRWRFD